jgi:hypothetical protein
VVGEEVNVVNVLSVMGCCGGYVRGGEVESGLGCWLT